MPNNLEIEQIKKINDTNKEENFGIYPIGLEIILSLISNGAEGETQKEVLNLLYYKDINKTNEVSNKIKEHFSKNDNILKKPLQY